MSALKQEAARELVLLKLGVSKPADIVNWADEIIANEPSPNFLLLELSTTPPARIDLFMSTLAELGQGSDYWSSVRDALPRLYDYLVANPDEAERVAGALDLVASAELSAMPSVFSFLLQIADEYHLAREGEYGTVAEVYADFLKELRRFKSGPLAN